MPSMTNWIKSWHCCPASKDIHSLDLPSETGPVDTDLKSGTNAAVTKLESGEYMLNTSTGMKYVYEECMNTNAYDYSACLLWYFINA